MNTKQLKSNLVFLAIVLFLLGIQSCVKDSKKSNTPSEYQNITVCVLANDGGLFALDGNKNLIRTDKNGNKLWYFENTSVKDIQLLLKWPNDDVLMIGTEKVKDTLLVGYDFYHITATKVSASGKLVWSNIYLGDNKFSYNVLNSGVLLPSGDICLSSTNKPIFSSLDPECQLIKLNTDGKVIHQVAFPSLRDVVLYNSDNTNMLMVSGKQIIKVDSSLKSGAVKIRDIAYIFRGFSDADGLLLHSSSGTSDKEMVPTINFYDLDGSFKFEKTYPNLKGYVISNINKGLNGHYLIAGSQGFADAGAPPNSDVMFMEIDAAGNLFQTKTYAYDVRDYGYTVFNRTGDYLLVGRAEHSEYSQLFSSWYVVGKAVWMSLDENGNRK